MNRLASLVHSELWCEVLLIRHFRIFLIVFGLWLLGADLSRAQEPQQQPPAPAGAQPPPAEPAPGEAPAPQAPPPAPNPARAVRPPRELPSTINNGTGFSIEPIYGFTSIYPELRRGKANLAVDPSDYVYPHSPKKGWGARVTVPTNRNGVLRFSYYTTKSTGSEIASKDLNLFNTQITTGDLLLTEYLIQNFKISYDYLTYFWRHGNQEVRLKTLWEGQRISVENRNTLVALADGSFQVTSLPGVKSVTLPTLGMGIEHTMSRHFRWEAKASGWGLPHKSAIGDVEGTVNVRYGHFELVLGGRSLYFKTSTKGDQYNRGTLRGPYIGLRYYWKKQ